METTDEAATEPLAGAEPEDPGLVRATARRLRADRRRDDGYRKAAQFLMLIDRDDAARVLACMSPSEVEGITREIRDLGEIDDRTAMKVLEEFGALVRSRDLVARGGEQTAREILAHAFGTERAETMLEQIAMHATPHPFAFMNDLDPARVVNLLDDEQPAVVALILAHLAPDTAAQTLALLPGETRSAIVGRIGRLDTIDPEVIRRTEEVLRDRIRAEGTLETDQVDGVGVLAEILKHLAPGRENEILSDLEAFDTGVARHVRERLFTLDVVFELDDRQLADVLATYADIDLAMLLRGCPQPVTQRLRGLVSEGRRARLASEDELTGPLPRRDVDRQVRAFLDLLRDLEQQGRLVIGQHAPESPS